MSPFMTVAILTVLWLVVVVPMIVHRGDEAARIRVLSRADRRVQATQSAPADADTRRQVSTSRAADSRPGLAYAARRPVPAAEEATMRSVHQPEMSALREAMMRRRRRSLSVLGVGSVITVLLAAVTGGPSWFIAGAFVVGLAGYFYSLRKQALRDRERRAARQLRAAHRPSDVDATRPTFARMPDSVVRIDDEDVELYAMDTVDLTGLYEDGLEYAEEHRRAG